MRTRGLVVACALLATRAMASAGDASLVTKDWTVGGVKREAIVYSPPAATTTETPVILVFHGHGGTARFCADHWSFHEKWPEAIVVYVQGLNTPTRRDPQGQGSGWQTVPGEQGDRDLLLVDAILASLEKDDKVDKKRVFAVGHSNGAGFCFLLWGTRGDKVTAFGLVGAIPRTMKDMKPHAAIQVVGKKDDVLPFETQERVMSELKRIDECTDEGKSWDRGTLYESKCGAPFVACIHDGGHEHPDWANDLIVKFFKELKR